MTILKILLCCSSGIDKELFMKKSIKNRFQANYKLTVGIDILTKDVEFIPGRVLKLSI